MKNLRLKEFLGLPDACQYDIIFEQGIFLAERYEESREYSLYAVGRFFVELKYEAEDNRIVGKEAFIAGKNLDCYCVDPGKLLKELL